MLVKEKIDDKCMVNLFTGEPLSEEKIKTKKIVFFSLRNPSIANTS
jgi:hypothetical protein